jgi:hypothetical protein
MALPDTRDDAITRAKAASDHLVVLKTRKMSRELGQAVDKTLAACDEIQAVAKKEKEVKVDGA